MDGIIFSHFEYTWKHIAGKQNVADPLSRHPAFFHALFANGNTVPEPPSITQEILEGYNVDTSFSNPSFTEKLTLNPDGLWMKSIKPSATPRIVIPNISTLKNRIISEHHDTRMAGHQGRDRTLDLVQRQFYWAGLKKDVDDYVRHCTSCHRCKPVAGKTQGTMIPLSIPTEPWEHVSSDFLTGL